MAHKDVSDVQGKPGMMQLCDAAHPRVPSLLDINLFPVKRLTWPCGTCEPTAGERANPGWVHTSLCREMEYFDRGYGVWSTRSLGALHPALTHYFGTQPT